MTTEDYQVSIKQILEDKNQSLTNRFRALFILRNLGGKFSIDTINNCFVDSSALLKHELAFCLGQMQNDYAVDYLISVLQDQNQETIVRHEAGEALGAIGNKRVISILEKYLNNSSREIRETCQLAIDRINWYNSLESKEIYSIYGSVDPAPPLSTNNLTDLETIYLDGEETLFRRYGAMFSLRNIGSDDAVGVLVKGLLSNEGTLFKHEVAYVLGQIRNSNSIVALANRLQDPHEHSMVRHECAEALGSIADNKCFKLLSEYLTDGEEIVRQSCKVALDMLAYEQSNSQLEHVDGIIGFNKETQN